MKKILAMLMIIAISGFGSIVFAAEGETPVVKGNIEVYGFAKVSVDAITTDAKAAGATKNLTRISSNSSRIGFKGAESLDDDMSAIMQLELGINYDGTQTSVVSSVTPSPVSSKSTNIDKITYRNSFAGLSSKTFGAIIFGINDTPYKISTGSLDPFGDTMGDYNAIVGNVNGSSDFDLRALNTVMYTSPKFAGIQILAQTSSTGQESPSSTTTPNKQEYSFSVTYNNGPLYVALADETHKNGYSSLAKANNKIEGTKVGVGYTIPDAGTKIGLVYEMLKDSVTDSANTRNAEYIAISQPFGKETVKLAYGIADKGKAQNVDNGANLVAIGVDHNFTKRTTVYVLYAKTSNNTNGTYGLGQSGAGGAYAPSQGEKPSVISFGVNHSF